MGTVTLDFQISASADDRDESGVGMGSITYVYVYTRSLTNTGLAQYRCNGLRFQSVTVPQGSRITSAYLSFYRTAVLNPARHMNAEVYGNDVDDADDFTDEADVIGRDRTTASVAWVENDISTGWVNSSDISTIIQEIVNRSGWASGQSIAILLIANTDVDKEFQAYSWDKSGTSYAVKLHVEYAILSIPFTPTPSPGIKEGTESKGWLNDRNPEIALPVRTLTVPLAKRTLTVSVKGT